MHGAAAGGDIEQQLHSAGSKARHLQACWKAPDAYLGWEQASAPSSLLGGTASTCEGERGSLGLRSQSIGLLACFNPCSCNGHCERQPHSAHHMSERWQLKPALQASHGQASSTQYDWQAPDMPPHCW